MADSDADTAPLTILLVEDDAAHAELVARTLEDRRSDVVIEHLRDGEAALNYLNACVASDAQSNHSLPALVLLDLRLPKVDGLELLQEIKSSARLKALPVVVLTTSDADRDVRDAYAAHANGYVVKPDEFSRFSQLMHDLSAFWLGWNHGAPKPGSSADGD